MAAMALEGIRVLDLTHYVAGPYGTKLLADYGADVIKIERPGTGDPARAMGPFAGDDPHQEKSLTFFHLNTNKRSLTLNLKSAAGRRLLLELVKDVDILVESFAPRVLPSLGLSYEVLAAANSKLVMTSISNFGQTGPYRDFKAAENVLYGLGGEMHSTGLPDREPLKLVPHAVQYMGGMVAAATTLGALYGARYQGLGQQVDISLIEVQSGGTERRCLTLLGYQYTKEIALRAGATGGGRASGIFPCQDGYFFLLAAAANWPRLKRMLGNPPGLEDPKWESPTAESDLDLIGEFQGVYLLPWLMERTMAECTAAGQEAGVYAAPLSTVAELLADPHFIARDYWVDIDHPVVGRARDAGLPFRLGASPGAIRRPAPLLGQHNAEVLGALGYSKEDLVLLREQGVI